MSASPRPTLLCLYHYDPLNRLINSALTAETAIQRFYCRSRLATEIQGTQHTSICQFGHQLLAHQQSHNDVRETTLLTADQQHSVLHELDAASVHPVAYTPYGDHPENGLLRFNGERPDPTTQHYHLGSGYRQFNPKLMRFNSPDNLSPFGRGGLNPYTYCAGNPVNQTDPSGHQLRRVNQHLAAGRVSNTGSYSIHNVIQAISDRLLFVNDRIIRPKTKNSLLRTHLSLGGAKAITKNARAIGIAPDYYLIQQLPEMQYNHPSHEELYLYPPTPTDKLTKNTGRAYNQLKNQMSVLENIADSRKGSLVDEADHSFVNAKISIHEEAGLLYRIDAELTYGIKPASIDPDLRIIRDPYKKYR